MNVVKDYPTAVNGKGLKINNNIKNRKSRPLPTTLAIVTHQGYLWISDQQYCVCDESNKGNEWAGRVVYTISKGGSLW